MHNDHRNLTIQTRDAYDFIAEKYASSWVNNIDYEIADRFCQYVPLNSRVLDVGCGPGQYTRLFHHRGLDVFGIDYSFKMIQQARRVVPQRPLVLMDMLNLGFLSESFDALWVCASIVHIHEQDVMQALLEFKRVLKVTTGLLFIGVVIHPGIPFRVEKPEEIEQYGKSGRFFQWYPNEQSFAMYLYAAGFTIKDVIIREITSNVLENAECKTNVWCNYYCVSEGS